MVLAEMMMYLQQKNVFLDHIYKSLLHIKILIPRNMYLIMAGTFERLNFIVVRVPSFRLFSFVSACTCSSAYYIIASCATV
jgi:hypothetical protein